MIILASQSPRRKELLSIVTNDFVVKPADVDESVPENIDVYNTAQYLSKIKANALTDHISNGDIVIGADTVVICDGAIFGKPKDYNDAFNMLKKLSSNTHQVITGVTIIKKVNGDYVENSFSVVTDVTFYQLSDCEIENYLESNEYVDKAGAYGIQGKASVFVEKINGDYFNVVGLPVSKLYNELKK